MGKNSNTNKDYMWMDGSEECKRNIQELKFKYLASVGSSKKKIVLSQF